MQAAINAAGNLLPSDLPAPPIYAKVNPADAPILTLAVTSKTDAADQGRTTSPTRGSRRRSRSCPASAWSASSGGQKPGVRIRANPTALAAYGLNIDDLRTTIANANVNTPKGNFDGPARAYTINANDQITDRRAVPATSSSPTATARRCGCRDVAHRRGGRGEHPARRLDEHRPRR